MIRRFALASAVLIAAASATPAMAGTATSNLGVGANVTNNCTISTTPIVFGAYDPIGTNASSMLDKNGSVSITCTTGASATIKLSQGNNAATGSTDALPQRRLKHASTDNYLIYQIFQDSSWSTVWGNTENTGVSETGSGAAQSKTVYGRIAAAQNVPTGTYSDTVVAEVAF
jgi:spore coat protein U-like protein